MKMYQSKTRPEIQDTGLRVEDFFENKKLLEDIKERFEESKRRSKADTQKRQSMSKNKNNKKRKFKK